MSLFFSSPTLYLVRALVVELYFFSRSITVIVSRWWSDDTPAPRITRMSKHDRLNFPLIHMSSIWFFLTGSGFFPGGLLDMFMREDASSYHHLIELAQVLESLLLLVRLPTPYFHMISSYPVLSAPTSALKFSMRALMSSCLTQPAIAVKIILLLKSIIRRCITLYGMEIDVLLLGCKLSCNIIREVTCSQPMSDSCAYCARTCATLSIYWAPSSVWQNKTCLSRY